MGVRQAIRVQKGQVAAAHGLMLVGITYLKACRIVGVNHKRLEPYIRRDWRRGHHPVPLKSLPGRVRKAYEILRETMGPDQAYAAATRNYKGIEAGYAKH